MAGLRSPPAPGRSAPGKAGERFTGPAGELIHAGIRIGDSVVMITEDAADGPA
jgi:uncharacterized glyoxalase superfamily protein PhnB